jgi:uncharacterized protein YbjT (DUF2867 family)
MTTSQFLVTGGTGKTGYRVTDRLRARGATVRTAARSGADVHFDWDDASTFDTALAGVTAVYLIPPTQRVELAGPVRPFLDRAEAAGVRHVTLLSARGVDQAPAEAPLRAVELDLAARAGLTHAIVRPYWFMQNFDEGVLRPVGDTLPVPTGDGAEAFVHADDIADVVVATLLAPADHDRAGYTLTGPEALTLGEVADHIAKATGRPITHHDLPADEWVANVVAAGLPADYAQLLAGLFGVVQAGGGTAVTDDIARVTGHAPRSFHDFVTSPEALAAWAT